MSTEGLFVRFTLEARKDEAASAAAGETKWKNVEYIEIHVPGDKTNIPYRPAEEADKARFATQYEAFKRGLGEVQEGQPLKTWPGITPAEVNMLAQCRVYTVEQLAAVSDENAGRIGPILALRDRARRYVEQSRADAPVQRLQAELDEARRREAATQERLARLEALLERQTAPEAPVPTEAPPSEPSVKRRERQPKPAEV